MALGGFCCCKHLKKPHFQEEEERVGKVGRLMENNDPADHGGQRGGAELADRIVARTRRVRFLMGFLNQFIKFMGVPANTTCAKFMCIYELLKIVENGGQDMDPRFRLVFALFGAALESFKCGLLMYILLADMPWPIVVLCVLMAFAFIAY